jgi:hypothetical protein
LCLGPPPARERRRRVHECGRVPRLALHDVEEVGELPHREPVGGGPWARVARVIDERRRSHRLSARPLSTRTRSAVLADGDGQPRSARGRGLRRHEIRLRGQRQACAAAGGRPGAVEQPTAAPAAVSRAHQRVQRGQPAAAPTTLRCADDGVDRPPLPPAAPDAHAPHAPVHRDVPGRRRARGGRRTAGRQASGLGLGLGSCVRVLR